MYFWPPALSGAGRIWPLDRLGHVAQAIGPQETQPGTKGPRTAPRARNDRISGLDIQAQIYRARISGPRYPRWDIPFLCICIFYVFLCIVYVFFMYVLCIFNVFFISI